MTGNFFFGAFLTPLDQRLVVAQGSEQFLTDGRTIPMVCNDGKILSSAGRINPFLIQGIMLTEEGLSPDRSSFLRVFGRHCRADHTN